MIGFLNPLGLLALASIGVLVALTLFARRTRTVPVSSLLLWKQIRSRPLERQRFRPDLLFVLRLLLLLALAGGYVRPYVARPGPGTGGGLAVVLDTSASMEVYEAGGTRFGLARAHLDDLVAALPAEAPVLLVTAADRPRLALRWTADRGRLAEQLAKIAPLDTPTALAPAVELALGEASRRDGARVVVLTDLPPSASNLPDAEVARVDWIAIGRRGDNVGITQMIIDAPPFGAPGDAGAAVVVHNFDTAPRTVTLEASHEGTPWLRHGVALPPRGEQLVPLGPPPGAGLIRVRVGDGDALAVDDEALGWVPVRPPLDVLLVTESDALGAAFRGLIAAVPGGRLEVVNRAGLSERAGGAVRPGAVTVFDRMVPDDGDGGGAGVLYVSPPAGNTVCPSLRPVDDASVVDWEPGHPLLAGLVGLDAVEAAHAMQLQAPAWGTVVMTAASRHAAYPFLVVGDVAGRRRACLAAELPPRLAASDTMPLVLLTLSTLRWLAEPVADVPITLATGVPVRAAGHPFASGTGVRAAGDPPVVLAEHTGVHRVQVAGGSERLVLASLNNETESDVGRPGGREIVRESTATAAPSDTPTTGGQRELSWWFYAAAAALLAIEWLAWGLAG
jgi:Aerotolerance regulator N-terminal/von Willebrand factor type A domain